MPEMVRTFTAVEITDEVLGRLQELIGLLRPVPADVKWVQPDNLHWTLNFLGDVELREISDVCKAVIQATADFEPFEVATFGLGAFPSVHRPRTIWVGIREGREQMIALQDALAGRLAKLGYRPEHRRFEPHLTIGRVRSGRDIADLARLINEHAQFDVGAMYVPEVVVFSSELHSSGATYQPLGRGKLGERGV
jgi:RNA 2',3'-cyclic 3'-phosphodiesterase